MKDVKKTTFLQRLVFFLILLAIGELAARGGSYFLETTPPPRSANHITYQDVIAEFDQMRFRYQPYSIWRPVAFSGKSLVIDSLGWRRTVQVEAPSRPKFHIGFFGGSTMMGWGCTDAQTIPSLVQSKLQNRFPEYDIDCHNYGVSAYSSSQEFITFWWESFQNEQPLDMAVFYDGSNEVWASFERKKPGEHNYYPEVSGSINIKGNRSKTDKFVELSWQFVHDGAQQKVSYLWRYVCRIAERWSWNSHATVESDPQEYAAGVARAYAANQQAIVALCRDRNIEPVFVLQPLAATTNPRPEFPNDPFKMEQLDSYFQASVANILKDTISGQHDFTAVLYNHPEVFFDWCHITGAGNELVADSLAAVIASTMWRTSVAENAAGQLDSTIATKNATTVP